MDWDLKYAQEWRKLGFYYEYDDGSKQWRLYGSKIGLTDLVTQLEIYLSKPKNNAISEHMHLGPYNYLKIMTWTDRVISGKWIAGTIADLKELSEIINAKLTFAKTGDIFKIGSDYVPNSEATMLFFIMADNFDPASIEFSL